MQLIKTKTDVVALLGSPIDVEDHIDIIDGLGDDYKTLIDSVHSRDTPILYTELHEKLLNSETTLITQAPLLQHQPITAHTINSVQNGARNWRPNTQNTTGQQNYSRQNNNGNRNSCSYLGKCQACGTHGPTANKCPLFRLVLQPSGAAQSPQAYNVGIQHMDSPSWLMDSGASHHITSDPANLSMHSPYTGGDDVVIADGQRLQITHTGSSFIPSPHRRLTLSNILRVPSIANNLISAKRLCTDNHVSVEFFPDNFQVKDLNSGVPLMRENSKSGGYEWPS